MRVLFDFTSDELKRVLADVSAIRADEKRDGDTRHVIPDGRPQGDGLSVASDFPDPSLIAASLAKHLASTARGKKLFDSRPVGI